MHSSYVSPRARRAPTVIVLWLIAVGACAHAAERTIYRCIGASGEAAFSDLPCRNGAVVSVGPVTTVDMAAPDADARAGIDAGAREARARRAEAGVSDAHAPRVMRVQASTADAERRCTEARERLDRVRATKRRGYKASRAAALDAQAREYRARVERECG